MRQRMNRITAMLLVLAICLSFATPAMAAEAPMNTADMKTVLNHATLYPQRTGYKEIDDIIAQILAPYQNADNYTKMVALYDWTVKNIKYSWEGYSKTTAPAYEYFTLKYNLTYEEGLQESLPKDMVYRTYHSLSAKKGVCYDYAIVYAVMARYLGFESYVHTGYYDFEDWSGIRGSGHHGWAEIVINGTTYIFDPQRDNRYTTNQGKQTRAFFGIPLANAWRYSQETLKNVPRDASMLPVADHRHCNVDVSVISSPSGVSVKGVGTYQDCAQVTLTSGTSRAVRAWYTEGGTLLATGPSYSFVPGTDTTLLAMFDGDYYLDVSIAEWYGSDVHEATDIGLVKGETEILFCPDNDLTRAMVVELLSRVAEADTAAVSAAPFTDVDQNEWYAASVNWAYENGVVEGISATEFAPEESVTREDFLTMIIRYLENEEQITAKETARLTYTDAGKISAYAAEAVAQAQALELLQGYPDGTVRPQDNIDRAEGVTFMMRMVRCIENYVPEVEDEDAPGVEDEDIPNVEGEDVPETEEEEIPNVENETVSATVYEI